MRAFETVMIRLAIEVLAAAATRAHVEPQTAAEVRLALRVVALYLADRDQLVQLWTELAERAGHPWTHARLMLGWSIAALEREGWEVVPGSMPCDGWAMCNRYRMSAAQAEIAARYGIVAPYPEDLTIPPPELFPARPAWTVRELGGDRRLETMHWGWPRTLPGKRPGTTVKTQVTNVRNLESPFWRSALADPKQRCLVPVTSFSEYGPGPKGRMPLFWFDVPSRPLFSFAGIFRRIDGRYHFAFLTCEPNTVVAPIHPKAMPVILHQEDEARWLAGDINDLVAPYPSQLMSVEQTQPADGRDRADDEQTAD